MEPPWLKAPRAPEPFAAVLPRLPQSPSLKNCLRLRGLPHESSLNTVLEFVGPFRCSIALEGVHMVKTNEGHPAGEAFIQMDSECAAFLAAAHLHRRPIMGAKTAYVEVLQYSVDDMNKLVTEAVPMARFGQPRFPFGIHQRGARPARPLEAVPTLPPACFPPAAYWPFHSPFSTSYRSRMAGVTAVHMRGLPYQATVQDVLEFFYGFPYLTADSIHMQRKPNGRPKGEATVAFPTRREAERAVRLKHLRRMGKRFIELSIA